VSFTGFLFTEFKFGNFFQLSLGVTDLGLFMVMEWKWEDLIYTIYCLCSRKIFKLYSLSAQNRRSQCYNKTCCEVHFNKIWEDL